MTDFPNYKQRQNAGYLLRDDFDGGPISVDQIKPNLWLGNLTAATDIGTITKLKLTHILTLDTCPLPRQIRELPNLTAKFIQISDQQHEDILSHLDDTYTYIDEALTNNNAVLVHCYFGVSRSASAVIAYIMKKESLTYTEAFEYVKCKRIYVYPNIGFVKQLKLYHQMGYKIDNDNLKYRQLRLSMAADMVRKAKILPQMYFDLIKPDPGLVRIQPEPNVYRCKKCRRVVASESNLMTHMDKSMEVSDSICNKIYFIEPLSWMKDITQSTQGKLHCPKCNVKLGSFSWVMGCQCPCGHQVSPAFYLTPSKIDWTNVVKNIEATV